MRIANRLMARRWAILVSAAALLAPLPAAAADPLRVERVVLLMRHGVRPPTKDPALPRSVTPAVWPAWPVAPGELTPHGAAMVTALGHEDAIRLRHDGLWQGRRCPAPADIRIVADSDERTIATADAWLIGAAPGCRVAVEHRPQGTPDPLFQGIGGGGSGLDPAAADVAIAQVTGPGGAAALERTWRPLLDRLDRVLCGTAPRAGCGVQQVPTAIAPADPDHKPKLSGALDAASTAAQVLLLEYAEGKPAAEVGWGRAGAADVAAFSAFHALEFRITARPAPIARANLNALLPVIRTGLADDGTAVTLISGHDTQVANLGGLLDVHWQVAGFAADDPAPGGALVLERLRDAAGHRFVRVSYRAQPLDTIRRGNGVAVGTVLRVPGCRQPALCTIEEMIALLR